MTSCSWSASAVPSEGLSDQVGHGGEHGVLGLGRCPRTGPFDPHQRDGPALCVSDRTVDGPRGIRAPTRVDPDQLRRSGVHQRGDEEVDGTADVVRGVRRRERTGKDAQSSGPMLDHLGDDRSFHGAAGQLRNGGRGKGAVLGLFWGQGLGPAEGDCSHARAAGEHQGCADQLDHGERPSSAHHLQPTAQHLRIDRRHLPRPVDGATDRIREPPVHRTWLVLRLLRSDGFALRDLRSPANDDAPLGVQYRLGVPRHLGQHGGGVQRTGEQLAQFGDATVPSGQARQSGTLTMVADRRPPDTHCQTARPQTDHQRKSEVHAVRPRPR